MPDQQQVIAQATLARNERAMLLILAGIQFCHVLDFMIMMPLGPFLINALSISTHEFALLVASYSFSAAVAGLLMAPVVDRFERKRFLLGIFVAFAIATLLCALSPGFTTLLIARGLAGIFGGMMGAMVHTMVADAIPFERRAKATSHGRGAIKGMVHGTRRVVGPHWTRMMKART